MRMRNKFPLQRASSSTMLLDLEEEEEEEGEPAPLIRDTPPVSLVHLISQNPSSIWGENNLLLGPSYAGTRILQLLGWQATATERFRSKSTQEKTMAAPQE